MEQSPTSIPTKNTANSCVVKKKENYSWKQPQDTDYGQSNNKILNSSSAKNQAAGVPLVASSPSHGRRTKKKLVRVRSTKTIQDLNQLFDWNCSTQNNLNEVIRKQEKECEEENDRESPTTTPTTGTSANSSMTSTSKSSLEEDDPSSTSSSTATNSRKSSSNSTIEEILSKSNNKKSKNQKCNKNEIDKKSKKKKNKEDNTRDQQQQDTPKARNAYKLERHLYSTKRQEEEEEEDDEDDYSTSTITSGAYRQLRSTTTFTTAFRTNKRYGRGKDNVSVASLPTQGLLLKKTNQVWELESLVALASVLDVAGYSQYCWEWWQKVSHKSKSMSCLGDQSSFLTATAKTGNTAAAMAAADILTLVRPVVHIPKSLVLHVKNQSFMQSLDDEQQLYTSQHHYMYHTNPSHHYSNQQPHSQQQQQQQQQQQAMDGGINNKYNNVGHQENNVTCNTTKASLMQEKKTITASGRKLDRIVEPPYGESCSTIGTCEFHPEEDENSTMASSTTTQQEDGLNEHAQATRFGVVSSLLGTMGEEVY